MPKLSSKRPSPALVISLLALFVALGGSAYAANQLAKNSVGAKQIKKNAVTAAKLKNNAVTTPKIKNEAITGAKIKETSLGPVPSATNATNAESAKTAVNATNAVNAANWSRYFTTGVKKAGLGQTITLGSIGPFTFIGKCIDDAGEAEAYTYLTTSQPGSFMYSESGDAYEDGSLDPGVEAEIGYGAEDTGPEWSAYGGYYSSWTAASPDGSVVVEGAANAGVNVFGAACAFNVTAVSAA